MNVTSLRDVDELSPFVSHHTTKSFGDDSKYASCTFAHIYTEISFIHLTGSVAEW